MFKGFRGLQQCNITFVSTELGSEDQLAVLHPCHLAASMERCLLLYDDYLCLLALNKQQIYMERYQTSIK